MKVFTETVNMITHDVKNSVEYERLVHVAYACGCVRTFHVEHNVVPDPQCAAHGDRYVCSTEESLPKERSAA